MVRTLRATPEPMARVDHEPTAWIQDLCPDFGHHTFQHASSGKCPKVLGRLAWGLDRLVTTAMSIPYARKIKPRLTDRTLQEYIDYHAFYSTESLLADPGSYFEPPPERVDVLERPARKRRHDPKGAKRVMLEFYSPFRTVNPQFREEYASLSPNERVVSRAWFHNNGPRPVVILLHGFSAPAYHVNTMWFNAHKFFEAGLDVVLMNLPMHGSRVPNGSRFHGGAIVHPSMWRTSEASAQGVMDLRILMRHLRSRGAPAVGVMGYSWGGYHAAMLACVDSSVDFIVSIAPVVSIGDLVMSWPTAAFFEHSIEQQERMIRELRKMLAAHTPLSHSLKIPPERVLLVASVNDGIVPATHTELLWKHFGRPRVYWSCGGHVLYFDKKRVANEALDFIQGLQLGQAPAIRPAYSS